MIFPFFAALYKCYTAGYLQTKSGHQKKKKRIWISNLDNATIYLFYFNGLPEPQ